MKNIAPYVTTLLLGVASMAQAQTPPVETVDGVSLPGVPVEVTERKKPAGAENEMPKGELTAYEDTNISLLLEPGTTEIVKVARNYLNRLVTPFENPKVVTVQDIQFKKEGSSIFVTTQQDTPVGLHILSNDPNDTRSISLALVPRAIPPRNIHLKWPGHANMRPGLSRVSMAKAERWEESSPYVETLMELFSIVARGEVPPGYSLVQAPEQLPCSIPGVSLYVGQRLTGSHFSVYVMRAKNEGATTVEIVQTAGCRANGVVAVAPWPNAHLQAGASTEVYIAVVNEQYEERKQPNLRPSLLKY